MKDIYALSNTELVRAIGRRFKTYRILCRLTQREVAEKSEVSKAIGDWKLFASEAQVPDRWMERIGRSLKNYM